METCIKSYTSDAQEVILSDQKRLMVDAYARYKITDPLLFYQTVRNENGARGGWRRSSTRPCGWQ